MPYVVDTLAVGLQTLADWFFGELPQLLLIKYLGELHPAGKDTPFLRQRLLQHGYHFLKPDPHQGTGGEKLGRGTTRCNATLQARDPGGSRKAGTTTSPDEKAEYDRLW